MTESLKFQIDQAAVEKIAIEAVKNGVNRLVLDSPMLKTAIEAAIAKIVSDVTPGLKDAIDKAVLEVTNKPGFMHAVIEKALFDSAPKLAGAFDASMRAAGKSLAMDRNVLQAVTDEVKKSIAEEIELKGIGQFS